MRTVTNTKTGSKHHFGDDGAFLRYARQIYKENEIPSPFGNSTIHWPPGNIQQATEYIHEYCGDLELTED